MDVTYLELTVFLTHQSWQFVSKYYTTVRNLICHLTSLELFLVWSSGYYSPCLDFCQCKKIIPPRAEQISHLHFLVSNALNCGVLQGFSLVLAAKPCKHHLKIYSGVRDHAAKVAQFVKKSSLVISIYSQP